MSQPKRLSLSQHVPIDSYHNVLSHGDKPKQGLMAFLQAPPLDPLDLLQAGMPSGEESRFLLTDVQVDQVVETMVELPKTITLGQESRMSECILWEIQENYYKNAGIDAWRENVPCFVTSSAYMAETYSEMVMAFIQDYYDQLDLNEPLYVIEMACGSGRLSHLMLRELENKLSCFEKTRNVKLKYLMTDFSDSNPNFWQDHDTLKPFVEKGMLDFAVFNPMVDQSLTLRVSGEVVSGETVKNPVIALANYFFDTIRQDVFRVESKRLLEGLVKIERNLEGGVDPESPPHITQVKPTYRYRELRNENYYENPGMNAVLGFYKHNVKNGTILMPLGAFEAIQNLQTISNHRVMLLSSDKAFNNYEAMICYYMHDYAIHGGAFSYMVNYDAIGRYFANTPDGVWMTTTSGNMSLQTVCCLEMEAPPGGYERLSYAFQQKLERLNLINTACTLLPDELPQNPVAQIEHWLAYIRLNLSDPKIFSLVTNPLAALMPHILATQQQELLKMMDIARKNFFFFPGEVNLPFWLSHLYFHLGMHEKSVECLNEAIKWYGEHEALLFLKGQSFEKINQWQSAQACYERALELQPNFAEGWEALMSIKTRFHKP
jgi:tetratricopeptide (TPR) repeat protein